MIALGLGQPSLPGYLHIIHTYIMKDLIHYCGYQTPSVRSPHRTLRFEIIIQIDEHDFAAKVPLRHQARLYLHNDRRLLIRARKEL